MTKTIRLILVNLFLLLATSCSTSQIPPTAAVDPIPLYGSHESNSRMA